MKENAPSLLLHKATILIRMGQAGEAAAIAQEAAVLLRPVACNVRQQHRHDVAQASPRHAVARLESQLTYWLV